MKNLGARLQEPWSSEDQNARPADSVPASHPHCPRCLAIESSATAQRNLESLVEATWRPISAEEHLAAGTYAQRKLATLALNTADLDAETIERLRRSLFEEGLAEFQRWIASGEY